MTQAEVFKHAMSLSIDERLDLIEELMQSVAEEETVEAAPIVDERLAAELQARLERHRANPGDARPWEQVRDEILRGLDEVRTARSA